MNSVNNRQQMYYAINNDPQLRRAEEALKGTDNRLADASSVAKNAVPAYLEHLAGQNKQLLEKYDQMVAKVTPQIMKLQEQVNQLAQHHNVKTTPGKEAAPSNPGTRGDPAAKQSGTSPDARGRSENTQASGRDAPSSLERLTAENKQLGERLNQMESRFNSVVKGLQDQIGDLSKKLGGAGTPQTRTPPAAQGQQGAAQGQGQGQGQGQANQGAASGQGKQGAAQGQGQANQGAASGQGKQDAAQSNESNPSARSDEANQAPRTLEDLARDNEQLRARIDQMMAEFSKVISELQKQIEQLNNQINSLKG
ncbi:phage shock protein A [Pseudomonas marginalis]|uniref:hypothetical protein n=1 Tax=Pseudomonas marginalis TaxID=298 RepID=UPI0020A0DF3C|nr:hypothetical protein [Pseudomonas marginalis]MCP1508206.1 phage shock protein A [Pseudomonas marginalis]MCP1525710.1 phage shock protein A [Pseudomonas marginalis]MDQ0498976.1 phage shock protein A [Pseudomonas marginalis]